MAFKKITVFWFGCFNWFYYYLFNYVVLKPLI